MKAIHTPCINGRYWAGILLASVAGTNLGDLYAHTAHLGIVKGLLVLALLAAAVFIAERLVDAGGELYYWLVILLIRTGATNIADYSMYRLHVRDVVLLAGLSACVAAFGWFTGVTKQGSRPMDVSALPGTGTAYWLAMLSAGVLGTVAGDFLEDGMGKEGAALALVTLFGVALLFANRRAGRSLLVYWVTVVVARTAGTAVGDLLAEGKALHIGLPLSTLLSLSAFGSVLVFWRARKPALSPMEAV